MTPRKRIAEAISSRQMRALEINAEYYGVSLLQLMENAGRDIAVEVVSRFPATSRVVIFCGLGGNGGDGFVTARHLCSLGYKVTVVLAGRSEDIRHEAALRNWKALLPLNQIISIIEVPDSSIIPVVEADVIVDSLLGTGTKGKLKPPIAQLVECINNLTAFKIAVDTPSGIDSDTGEVLGSAVKSNLTVTFHAPKIGLGIAKKHVGELLVKDIGLPKQLENYAGPGDVLSVGKRRSLQAHKGDFGRLLVIGGSEVYSGAPSLVSLAALRTGVDIVYTAAPEKTSQAISSLSPDLITIKLEGKHLKPRNLDKLKPYIETVDAVALGPGLGLASETIEFVKLCVDSVENAGKSLLLDADGLKAFAEFKRRLKVPFVLTPHAGEYTILTRSKLSDNMEKNVSEVRGTAAGLNGVILLKGQVDIICSADQTKLNFTGNPGMTVGGTGDVLSGIVSGLLAQRVAMFEAAVAGAFVNGAAGDFAYNEVGYHMLASDIIEWIPGVFNDPMSHVKVRRNLGSLT
jgi:NAD(P)H-hydrate epimerase